MAAWAPDPETVEAGLDWLDASSLARERELAAGYPMADFECSHSRLVDCDECEQQLAFEVAV